MAGYSPMYTHRDNSKITFFSRRVYIGQCTPFGRRGVHWPMYTLREKKSILLLSGWVYIDQCTPTGRRGVHWPMYTHREDGGYWSIPFRKSYLFFLIIQCQWHNHGSEVLANTLLILRGSGNTSSSVGFASGDQRYCLNLSGFGGYSPIPPRHGYAIVSILRKGKDWSPF